MVITQECCELYQTSPGGSSQQSSGCTATYHPSRKLSKLDKPDIWDTAGQVGTNSLETYSGGPLHMDEQRQDDQLESTYSSSVPIWDAALKTCQKQWIIEKGGISMLMVRHDDDDEDYVCSRIMVKFGVENLYEHITTI